MTVGIMFLLIFYEVIKSQIPTVIIFCRDVTLTAQNLITGQDLKLYELFFT